LDTSTFRSGLSMDSDWFLKYWILSVLSGIGFGSLRSDLDLVLFFRNWIQGFSDINSSGDIRIFT
jgi:hypothetical protein